MLTQQDIEKAALKHAGDVTDDAVQAINHLCSFKSGANYVLSQLNNDGTQGINVDKLVDVIEERLNKAIKDEMSNEWKNGYEVCRKAVVKSILEDLGIEDEATWRGIQSIRRLVDVQKTKIAISQLQQEGTRELRDITDEDKNIVAEMYGGIRCVISEDGFWQIIDSSNFLTKYFAESYKQEWPSRLVDYLRSKGYKI